MEGPELNGEEDKSDLAMIRRDMRAVLLELRKVTAAIVDAESEVPEKMRRFIMYYHDAHDVQNLYHESGIVPPKHIQREVERCADRFRHLLDEQYGDGGTFEKVRQEMSKQDGNRYDFSKQLTTEKHEP